MTRALPDRAFHALVDSVANKEPKTRKRLDRARLAYPDDVDLQFLDLVLALQEVRYDYVADEAHARARIGICRQSFTYLESKALLLQGRIQEAARLAQSDPSPQMLAFLERDPEMACLRQPPLPGYT